MLQFSMALLIDGYNLLHVTDIFGGAGSGTVLHRTRLALLEFLASSVSSRERAQTTIVFDAAGAPPGLPQTLTHDRMTVHFAREYSDADAMLEELIEQHAAPRSLTVVSSDHRVQRAARHRGATFVDSDVWFRQLKSARRTNRPKDAKAISKPAGDESPDQVAYWLNKFSEPLPPEEPRRPMKRPPRAAASSADPASEKKRKSRPKKSDAKPSEKPVGGELDNPFPPGYADDLLD